MEGNGTNQKITALLIAGIVGTFGWTVKQSHDIYDLKLNLMPRSRLEKHLYIIERELDLDPKKIDANERDPHVDDP
jgi:hypothetical protein